MLKTHPKKRRKNMNYTKIDVESWERRDLFKLYTTDLKIVMNMTVDVDITNMITQLKKNGLRFYPAMIWVVSRLMNARDEFKYHLTEDGELIKWDYVSPSYTDFNPETEKFNKFVTEYSPDFKTFYDRVVADCEKHKNETGFLPNQPKNTFDISCLPWTSYKSLDLHIYSDGKSLFPIVIWGKYHEENGRIIIPVTAMLHHAVCDGFTVSRFFNELSEAVDNFKI